MNNFLTIEQIEEDITSLCRKRAEILYQEGIEEPYLVFDNNKGNLNENVWVLDPEYERDLIKIVFDEMHCSAEEHDRYNRWLDEYGKNSCSTKCINTRTPICCCVCENKRDCEEALTRCGNLDKMNGLRECERRGKYEGK